VRVNYTPFVEFHHVVHYNLLFIVTELYEIMNTQYMYDKSLIRFILANIE